MLKGGGVSLLHIFAVMKGGCAALRIAKLTFLAKFEFVGLLHDLS